MSLILYYSPASTACRSTLLTLMALNVTFTKRLVNLTAKEQMKPDFLQINPFHKLPTIDDGDEFRLWESHAINAYLASKYDKTGTLCPKDPRKRALVDQRLHFDTEVLFPCFRRLVVDIVKERTLKSVTQELTESFEKVYDSLAPFFVEGTFIAGENITVADFSFIVSLTTMDLFVPIQISSFPLLADYVANCLQSMPYLKEANEPGLQIFKDMVLKAGFTFPKTLK